MSRAGHARVLALGTVRLVVAVGVLLGGRAPVRGEEQSSITILGEQPKPPPAAAPAPPAAPLPPEEDDDPKRGRGREPVGAPTSSPDGGAPFSPTPGVVPPPPGPGTQAPGTPGQGMQVIPVPAGTRIEDVKVPETAVTSNLPGIGQKIVELHIRDNLRTLSNTIEYVSGLRIGRILTAQLYEDARVRLYSTGLFKDVAITWEAPSPRHAGEGIRVVVRVHDKHPWVIAPIFSYQARNYGGGLAFAHNNVLKRGIKLLVYGDYTTAEKMLLLVWLDPSIADSPFYYRLDTLLRRDSIVEYAYGHISSPRVARQTDLDTVGVGMMIGVNIKRRFHIDLRLKLYRDWTRAPECYNTTNTDGSGTPDVVADQGGYCRSPSSSGWDNTLTTSIGWDSRSKVNGVQRGLQVTLSWQYGAPWLGDRWSYHLFNLSAVYAFRFWKEHNLILRAGGDLQFDPPFKNEVEAGSLDYTLRGSLYRQFRGDTSAHATVEYIAPLFTVLGLSVRAIGFFDTNLTWFRNLPVEDRPDARLVRYGDGFRNYLPGTPSGVSRESFNNGVGVGIRMYLRGVVLPLIGFDVAYGIEANTFRYYLAIGSVLD